VSASPPAAVRVDRWLWSVRAYKSRSAATKACVSGQVTIDDSAVKPARRVSAGDVVTFRRSTTIRILKVREPIEKRVGAAIAVTCYEDLSPPQEPGPRSGGPESIPSGSREPGSGRPTKRDRRRLDQFRSGR